MEGVQTKDLGVFANYSKGFEVVKKYFGILLGIVIVYFLISIPSSVFNDMDNGLGSLLGYGWSIFVTLPTAYGVSWSFLKAVRGQKPQISDMFEAFKGDKYVNAILSSLLSGLIIIVGFILLILPGIYFAIKLSFVQILVMDKNLSAMDAIKESWNRTSGYELTLLGMFSLAIPLLLVGLVALVVGVIISIMIIMAANAVLYNGVE